MQNGFHTLPRSRLSSDAFRRMEAAGMAYQESNPDRQMATILQIVRDMQLVVLDLTKRVDRMMTMDGDGEQPIDTNGTMMAITREVAEKHDVTIIDIISQRRTRKVVLARHEAIWRCRQETIYSLPRIGLFFGARDHSSIDNAVSRHKERIEAGAA